MKQYYLIKAYFLHCFRTPISLIMMVIFPIILITILSFSLKSSFSSDNQAKIDFKIAYNTTDEKIIEYLETFKEHFEIELINTKYLKDIDLSLNKYDAFIESKNDHLAIKINENAKFKAKILNFIINNYFRYYNLYSEIAKEDPSLINKLNSDLSDDIFVINNLNSKANYNSTDFYAISIIVQMGLYASLNIIYFVHYLRENKIMKRINLSKISKLSYSLSLVLANVLVSSFQISFSFLFSIFILKANITNNLFSFIFLFLSLVLMSSLFGILLAINCKSITVISVIPQILISILTLIGGAYIPVDLGFLSRLSPVFWTNRALLGLNFNLGYGYFLNSLTINLTIALILFILLVISHKRRVME